MKSNVGFMQILTFLLILLDAFRLIEINIFLMVFLIFIAWADSYVETNR